ncbi:pyrimidine reductase [Pseudoflavonifractor sp. 524-17]|uniref:dihydrofolate reductase family protein n=1 Tax=Pseudoflavonifractor sp. 524-17 TaxID=2304577 RepID=UPI00137AFD6E|nr:dihydrofolate reductase family protein [Pseudoflavonifractor sp. 524-17]NCE65131.1 pyrimidine reductase [Pseudoflavonifractor sp. 524-17]
MNQLNFFQTPKDNLKIDMVFRDEALLAQFQAQSAETAVLPDVQTYYTDLYFPKAPEDRPYTFSSIVLSSDGKMAYHDNPAGPLVAKNNFLDPDGSLGDFWVLNVLRAYSDGIIVGANTLAKEPGITCHVYDQDLNAQRVAALGKKQHPVSVVVSFDATDIPFDHYTFQVDPAQGLKLVIATGPDGMDYIKAHSPLKHVFCGPFRTKEDVDQAGLAPLDRDFDTVPVIVTGEGKSPDGRLMMYVLKKLGLEKLCVESPSYCAYLLKEQMLDEYFINYSMVFVGGTTTPGSFTPFGHLDHPHGELVSLGVHHSSFLFTRQKLRYNVKQETDLSSYSY